MSSKRKSPPTKLQEGVASDPPSEPAHTTAIDQESDIEDRPSLTPNFYKYSPASSNSSTILSDDELNSYEEDKSSKRQQDMTNNLLIPSSFLTLHQVDLSRRRGSSECSSPGAESKILGLCNNNNSLLNHNSALSLAPPHKRSMDDVLKRLTSKKNSSSIREEKRPTPSTTPVKQNK